MRRLLIVTGLLLIVLPLLGSLVAAQGQGTSPAPPGPLGPVNALGQDVKRPPAPPVRPPRLPDGTIDLGDGIWVEQSVSAASGSLKRG